MRRQGSSLSIPTFQTLMVIRYWKYSAEKGFSCFDPSAPLRTGRVSMNGKSSMFSMHSPFALSLSKGERGVFQQNLGRIGEMPPRLRSRE